MNGKIGLKNAHILTDKRIISQKLNDVVADLAVKPYLCDVIFTPVSAEFGACRARLEHHLAERFGVQIHDDVYY